MSLDNVSVADTTIFITLEDCVEVLDNLRKPVNNSERLARIENKIANELYPYYGATGQVGWIDDYLFDGEFIALGEDGVPFLDPFKNKAYMLHGKTWVNNHAHVLLAIKGVSINKYIFYFLNYFDYLGYVNGGTRLKLTQANMRKIPINLPSFNEQQEIVRQLDVMLAQVEQIKSRLDAIPAILKKFCQSVLADALSGKLTEEWRNSDGSKCDLESELMQIKVNRESKIFGNQKRSLDFSVDANLKPVVELPVSWKLVGLGDLIEFLTDYHANGSYEKLRDHVTLLDVENYACMIRATNFEKNNFDDLLIYIDQTAYEFLTKTKLFGNEILISKIGNAGSVYLMPKLNRPCSLAMNLFMLRFDEGLVNPRYINYFLISIFGEKYISQYVRGVATKSIDKKSVRNVFVHYPCFNEQNQIVKIIDQLFEHAKKIEDTVQSAQKRVNLLTQSILAKAFSGELTSEWREQHQELITGINSAESLLTKIQAERDASKPVKKTRAKKEV